MFQLRVLYLKLMLQHQIQQETQQNLQLPSQLIYRRQKFVRPNLGAHGLRNSVLVSKALRLHQVQALLHHHHQQLDQHVWFKSTMWSKKCKLGAFLSFSLNILHQYFEHLKEETKRCSHYFVFKYVSYTLHRL